MTPLTEKTAGAYLASRALLPGLPGLTGLEVDLLLSRPGLPAPLVGSLRERPPLRHGHLHARSARIVVVSGPPSPGADDCAQRMAEDLAMPGPLIAGHGVTVLDVAADPGTPIGAGVRVFLEAGADDASIRHRWAVAHAIAPVLGAAFANAPMPDGRLTLRRLSPAVTGDPRADWARQVLDSPSDAPSFRQRLRAGERLTLADLAGHEKAYRPAVAARNGLLEINVADRQPGDGWRVPLAVISALIDDPAAIDPAALPTGEDLWQRASRWGLADPVLAAGAKTCFLAAYGALSRRGADRRTRDAVAVFLDRYVLRGRCPADDRLVRWSANAPKVS